MRKDQGGSPRGAKMLPGPSGTLHGMGGRVDHAHMADLVVSPMVVVPVGLLSALEGDTELCGPAGDGWLGQGKLKREDVCVG